MKFYIFVRDSNRKMIEEKVPIKYSVSTWKNKGTDLSMSSYEEKKETYYKE